MVNTGALRSPVPLPGWITFNIRHAHDCTFLGFSGTAAAGVKSRSCTRSCALPGRNGGNSNIIARGATFTHAISSARIHGLSEPGAPAAARPLSVTSPRVRTGVAVGASRRATTTQHIHETLPDASATTAVAYTAEQQQDPADSQAGPGAPASGPARRRRRRTPSPEQGPHPSGQHADHMRSSYCGGPYLPNSSQQQQEGASFANGSGFHRHSHPGSALSHGNANSETELPGTWGAPPPPPHPASFPAPVAVAAPPPGSVMSGWALMGDQSRMNGVYR